MRSCGLNSFAWSVARSFSKNTFARASSTSSSEGSRSRRMFIFAQRTMLYDWYQDFGDAIDWSQGVMGLPFSAPHFAGWAKGDFSEIFFGKRKA